MVNATWKIKKTINGSKTIKRNYSTVDKSLVGKMQENRMCTNNI